GAHRANVRRKVCLRSLQIEFAWVEYPIRFRSRASSDAARVCRDIDGLPDEGRKDQPSARRPCLPTAVLPRSFISFDRCDTWLMIRRISERVSIVLNSSAIAGAPERKSGLSSTVRTASRKACGVGQLVARLIPTPDHATRAFTSALSSVNPAVTSGIPKLIAWLTLPYPPLVTSTSTLGRSHSNGRY